MQNLPPTSMLTNSICTTLDYRGEWGKEWDTLDTTTKLGTCACGDEKLAAVDKTRTAAADDVHVVGTSPPDNAEPDLEKNLGPE